jgi:hypothetical protein
MARTGINQKQKKTKVTDKKQSERFLETARKLGVNQSMEEFARTFKKIAPKSPTKSR